jgi:hypothetical protein
MNRRLHEPLQDHIHSELCSEVNETLIGLKLNSEEVARESTEQQNKIIEARKNHPDPLNDRERMIDLLTRIRNEMDNCKIPFKRY